MSEVVHIGIYIRRACLTDFCKEWKGRLIVDWPPPERSWWRWADRNRIPVSVIHEQSILDAEMPRWDEMKFSWKELKLLPAKWKVALGQWRGIYLHLR